MGGGDSDLWNIDPEQQAWMGANTGTPTWDGSGQWDTGPSWWERNTPSPETLAELRGAQQSLGGIKPMADPNAANARPMAPTPGMHQGQGGADLLNQYLQILQQRQQQMRTQFLPKTAGLLGG